MLHWSSGGLSGSCLFHWESTRWTCEFHGVGRVSLWWMDSMSCRIQVASLLLFMLPHPSFPMALFEIVLSLPTFAFKSPITVFISWHGVHSLARLATTVVIKCILALFLAVVGRCIQLVDGDVDVLSLHSDPAVDRLPWHQALLHSFSHGMMATPSWCWSLSLSLYNTISLVLVLYLPDPDHRLLLIPRMCRL